MLERGQSRGCCGGVCVDPPPTSSWWLVCLMFELGEGTWRWRTVEDLVKKVEGVFMIASFRDCVSYTLYSVLIVGDCWRVHQACVRLCEFLLAGLGFVLLPLVFVFSRAWLLEWDCDLKWISIFMVPWISLASCCCLFFAWLFSGGLQLVCAPWDTCFFNWEIDCFVPRFVWPFFYFWEIQNSNNLS